MDDEELMAMMKVDLPHGEVGGMRVEAFDVPDDPVTHLRQWGSRYPEPGTYTRLIEGDRVWMSDTRAERLDHLPAMREIRDMNEGSVLVNGLGLGCIITAALRFDHVTTVVVVENDWRVLDLLAEHYVSMDRRVRIVEADAYEFDPHGTYDPFGVVWHDIWPAISTDNLPGMRDLFDKYKDCAYWQGAWALSECVSMHAVERELMDAVLDSNYGKVPTELAAEFGSWAVNQDAIYGIADIAEHVGLVAE